VTPEQVRQLAEFLPEDWGHVGPSIIRPSSAPPPEFEGARAFNPIGGAPPSVETPLRVLGATSLDTDLVLRLLLTMPDDSIVIVWVVRLAETPEALPLREISNGVWGMLLRRISADLLSQTVVTSTGVRLLID
jgi:hypothetical protein